MSSSRSHQPSLECVILIGLPGSGKTTFFRERFASTHTHVSKDNFRHARNRKDRQRKMLADELAAGHSVVVDNTNPSPLERAPIIAAARQAGARVVGYFFDVPVRLALVRNRQRAGVARVPDVAVFTIAKKLRPPSREEGFDRLFRVSFAESGEAIVDDVVV